MDENKELNATNGNTNGNANTNTETSLIDNINKNYKILYDVFFKYGIIIIIAILATVVFFISINKKSTTITQESGTQEIGLIRQFEENSEKLEELEKTNENLKIKVKQGTLDVSETMILSYNNLISFKGLIMPRGTFLDDFDTIKGKEYFSNGDYDTSEIENLMKKIILIDYDAVGGSKNIETNTLLNLKNNSIDDTFSASCATRPRLSNKICDEFISNFLDTFYVYKIENDISGTLTILRALIGNKKYKEQTCKSLDKYFTYANTAPSELEDIVILCGEPYLDKYYIIQDFINIKDELENKYIKQNISKYSEINDYKLISFQQILYNNLEQGIPPSEGLYKYYTNFLINILKKSNTNPIDSLYFDTTYWFNNGYIIPQLNKLKYQLTTTKKNEIESIIANIEKINNGSNIDGYLGLKYMLTNKGLEEDVKNMGRNITSNTEDTMSILLKSIKKLSYLKLINDEIIGDTLDINGYFSVTLHGAELPIYFGAKLQNKNGNLIVTEITLNGFDELQNIIGIIIQQKDNSIGEIHEFIQDNIALYVSDDYNITPCGIIETNLKHIVGFELLLCNGEKINIIKGESGDKVLYQFKMNNYNIQSIVCTNKEIQSYIDKNYSNTSTNTINIGNIVEQIVSYVPTKQEVSDILEGNNKVITALEDFKKYLGVDITDIAEQEGKVAAEFMINGVPFVGIYDTRTKELGPLYLKEGEENNYNIVFKKFSLYLKPDNQNEINKFILETYDYLYELDKLLAIKYLSQFFENLFDEQ